MVAFPKELETWTADEVAECLDVGDDIYNGLWNIVSEAENPTPLGGDGSNGTVETPDGRLSADNDDKTPHWWGKFDKEDQERIVRASNTYHAL